MPIWVWILVDLGILVVGGIWLATLAAKVARNGRRLQRIVEPAVSAAEALQNAASQGK